MKTHELAVLLELNVKLLRTLPNVEVDDAIRKMIDLAAESKDKRAKKPSLQRSHAIPEGIEDKLSRMTPAEIEDYLARSEEFSTTVSLKDLAERLKISGSKRQSHSALVNLIVRHFEASRMDSIIRTAGKQPERSGG